MRSGGLTVVDGRYRPGDRVGPPVESHVRLRRDDESAQRPDNTDMRVLVVEDEISLAQAVERGLTAEGFEVDVVHNGLDGLWPAPARATTARSSSTSCCRA